MRRYPSFALRLFLGLPTRCDDLLQLSYNSSLAAEKEKNLRLSRTFLDWILGPQGHAYASICDHIAEDPQGRDQTGPRASRYPFPRLEERTGQSMPRCLLFTGQLGERAKLA